MAARQHGVVARGQILRLGFSPRVIEHRLATHRMRSIHRGVYALTPLELAREGRWMAAVIAAGPGALLSHRSAAALWGLIPPPDRRPEVTAPRRPRRAEPIDIHETRAFDPADRARRAGIEVTTVARTLLDLAAVAPLRLGRAVESAERLELFDLRDIRDVLRRCRGRRGAGRLRAALAIYEPMPFTRSELERRFVRLVRRAGVPPPAMNAWVGRQEVDALWEDQRLVVELDGYESHRTRAAFERDRRRDADLRLAGYDVIRLTWRQVVDDGASVAALLRRRLAPAILSR